MTVKKGSIVKPKAEAARSPSGILDRGGSVRKALGEELERIGWPERRVRKKLDYEGENAISLADTKFEVLSARAGKCQMKVRPQQELPQITITVPLKDIFETN